jgi:general nucleoside transport system ATP-binding protein
MRVELVDIRKYFGPVHANDGISLVFEPGTIYALLGENGAGKSTLMKILSGYQKPTSGTITINEQPASFNTPIDALKAGVGMLYQDPADFPPLRVVENYLFAYDEKLPLDFHRAVDALKGYAGRFGFQVDQGEYVEVLTLGERQQLELLRLLALGAEVLILDEPTTGISAEQKDVLFNTMRRLASEEGKTIILVSHKLEEVQQLCNKIAVLRSGKLVGTRDLPAPTSDLVRMMFGEETPHHDHDVLSTDDVILKIEDACCTTRLLSINDIDLNLRAGEVVGLAGLEGSGQRELLQASAGLLPLDRGYISIGGLSLENKRSVWLNPTVYLVMGLVIAGLLRAADLINIASPYAGLKPFDQLMLFAFITFVVWLIGTILSISLSKSPYHAFQEHGGAYVPAGRLEEGLVPGLSLTEHMALVKPDAGFMVNWDEAAKTIAERIQRYNIVGRPTSEVQQLSGGNQQRAMLGLLKTPLRVLLLEHPTRGLDVTSANWIWELFRARRAEGTAIMFMSADLDELRENSDRIAVFSGGKMQRIVNASDTTVEELGHLIGGQQV